MQFEIGQNIFSSATLKKTSNACQANLRPQLVTSLVEPYFHWKMNSVMGPISISFISHRDGVRLTGHT